MAYDPRAAKIIHTAFTFSPRLSASTAHETAPTSATTVQIAMVRGSRRPAPEARPDSSSSGVAAMRASSGATGYSAEAGPQPEVGRKVGGEGAYAQHRPAVDQHIQAGQVRDGALVHEHRVRRVAADRAEPASARAREPGTRHRPDGGVAGDGAADRDPVPVEDQ